MDYEPAIIAAAQSAGIDSGIALAVARRESGAQQYWQDDRNGHRKGDLIVSPKGAIGIMQVLPSTAPGVDLTDAAANIRAGVSYLASLHRRFADWPLALAAYNWGEGHVAEALQGWRRVPAEVERYVAAIVGPGKLTGVSVGTVALAKAGQGAHQVAREHPGLLAVGILLGTIVVIRVLQ